MHEGAMIGNFKMDKGAKCGVVIIVWKMNKGRYFDSYAFEK